MLPPATRVTAFVSCRGLMAKWPVTYHLIRLARGLGRLAASSRHGRFAMPVFLVRPPESASVPYAFAEPSMEHPQSQLCTHGQMQSPLYRELAAALGLGAAEHRKLWEFAWILAVLRAVGLLRPGVRALGFGVGREPLPAYFASIGAEVLATDAPTSVIAGQGWDSIGQHAATLDALRQPHLISDTELARLVRFSPVDMNAIPATLSGFDFCWSACALEHLGSLDHGMRFIEASLATLRPGGIAVHTTEFNLSSNDRTAESPEMSLYRKRDIEALFERLVRAGHQPLPLNLHPGAAELDEYVDLPPYSPRYLKLEIRHHVCTSIGIAVRRG